MRLLSTRELQAYGAICLALFCAKYRINAMEIWYLIEHLLTVLVSDNLAEWEIAGSKLEVPARGDPMPDQVRTLVPVDQLSTMERLVSCVAEIGLADMYGADTDLPSKFANQVVRILEEAGIVVPPLNVALALEESASLRGGGWGEPVDRERYKAIRTYCLGILKS